MTVTCTDGCTGIVTAVRDSPMSGGGTVTLSDAALISAALAGSLRQDTFRDAAVEQNSGGSRWAR